MAGAEPVLDSKTLQDVFDILEFPQAETNLADLLEFFG